MLTNLPENARILRHVLDDLPVGIYVLDRERRIRLWNKTAAQITGRFGHEVMGQVLEQVVHPCDAHGRELIGEHCAVEMTLHHGQPQQSTAYYLHKEGHRTAVRMRTRPIFDSGDVTGGVTVLFEEAAVVREEVCGPPLFGCLDPVTGIPSLPLTRAVLSECMASARQTHSGFGVLRVRLLGLKDFSAKHGPQSAVPFLRITAQTLRHSLDGEFFLGCWENHEFLALLPKASLVVVAKTAESAWNLLGHSEVCWWGDHFAVGADVAYAVAHADTNLTTLLGEMKPVHSSVPGRAVARAEKSAGEVQDHDHDQHVRGQ